MEDCEYCSKDPLLTGIDIYHTTKRSLSLGTDGLNNFGLFIYKNELCKEFIKFNYCPFCGKNKEN